MSSELSDLRDSILENLRLSKTMCPDNINRVRTWQWDNSITLDRKSYLTEQGWNDLKYLAKRLKKRFPAVLSERYRMKQYLFHYTSTQRTEASFRAFVDGLFGNGANNYINAEPETYRNTMLRSYKFCPAYDQNKKRIKHPDSESSKFLRSRLYLQTLSDISTQLGFNTTLSSDQFKAMWDACRFEQAWYPKHSSTWCSVFNETQIKVLEYKEDLKYYYQNSYGYEKSADLACYTIADMVKNLQHRGNPRVVAYFTHETELQIFLTALGAFKDPTPLQANNFDLMGKRLFKSSQWTPFAANVLAVKYHCRERAEPVNVGFFLNEKHLELDWCRGRLCSWSEVVQRFRRYVEGDCSKLYCS